MHNPVHRIREIRSTRHTHENDEINTMFHCIRPIFSSPAGEVRSIAMSVSVCRFVCVSARISQKPRVQTSRNLPCNLPVAVALSSYDDNVICSVLPVLWMKSIFQVMGVNE